MSFARVRFHAHVQDHNQGPKVSLRGLRGGGHLLLHFVTFIVFSFLSSLPYSFEATMPLLHMFKTVTCC